LSQLWYREFYLEMTMGRKIQVNNVIFVNWINILNINLRFLHRIICRLEENQPYIDERINLNTETVFIN